MAFLHPALGQNWDISLQFSSADIFFYSLDGLVPSTPIHWEWHVFKVGASCMSLSIPHHLLWSQKPVLRTWPVDAQTPELRAPGSHCIQHLVNLWYLYSHFPLFSFIAFPSFLPFSLPPSFSLSFWEIYLCSCPLHYLYLKKRTFFQSSLSRAFRFSILKAETRVF